MTAEDNIAPAELLELKRFAEEIADQTRALILDLWTRTDLGARLKSDRTPVTVVDLEAEQLTRRLIRERYPEHGVLGEEYEPLNPSSRFQWTIDPIDGTQNLVNRIPTFGTLIGLRLDNEAVIGVIDHPVLDLRCSGGKGLGVSYNGSPIKLEDLPGDRLTDNDLVATNTLGVFGRDPSGEALFQQIIALHPHLRIYYDCYAHTLAVAGSLAAVVEPNLKVWDLTPAEVLIREAGGAFKYFGSSNHQQPAAHTRRFNAVFGKPKAVAMVTAHL